jgi:lysophospholipase L1-like esterase
MKYVAVLLIGISALAGCATPGGGGGGSSAPPSCEGPQWAVGDSITNESNVGIPGWPNEGTASGHWVNYGVPGAKATILHDWTIAELAKCTGPKPTLIVFEAGLNDIHFGGATAAQVEAIYADLIAHAGVPVRIMTLVPYVQNGPWAVDEPVRDAVNSWIRSLPAARRVDCAPVLEGSNGWLNPAYSIDNAVHLTQAGEVALANCVEAVVGP